MEPKKKCIHEGHRQRLRDLISKVGLENVSDINKLEYILTLCIPRIDTNILAHTLLDHFGSFSGVLNAKTDELIKIPGIGTNTAKVLPIFKQIAVAFFKDSSKLNNVILNYNQLIDYVYPLFLGATVEQIYIIYMKNECTILKHEKVADGTFNNVSFNFAELAKKVLFSDCSSIMIAHNHPSGNAVPSQDDVNTTENIRKTLMLYGLKLIDSLVVSPGSFYSFKSNSLYEIKPTDR